MALAGFLTFGSKTKGNVLNNFPSQGHIMVQIARLCFGLNMLTTLPLEAFVCREVMNNYWFPEEPYQPNRHLIFSTSLVVSAMTISLLTCDLGAVFELIGATSACVLAYILPPLCYVKLSTRSWKTVPAIACIVFGVAVMVISSVLAVAKMIRSKLFSLVVPFFTFLTFLPFLWIANVSFSPLLLFPTWFGIKIHTCDANHIFNPTDDGQPQQC